MAGIPLPLDRSGLPTNFQVPLDRVYIHVQAIIEETSRAQSDAKRIRVEEEAQDKRSSVHDLIDAPEVVCVRALGEYLYRQGQEHKEGERPKPINPQDALSDHGRIAILGDPGVGKSTMLRFLARKAAENAKLPVPIMVSLRDYATYCGSGGTESLYDFAIDEVSRLYNYNKTDLRRAIGQADHLLWLVDGLDEARGWREKVVGQIGQLPGNLVITSRSVGYQKAGLESLPHFKIMPIETEDVDKFLNDWFGVLADQGDLGPDWVAKRVSWLKDQLKDRPRISSLTNNPLLLTFFVILSGEDPLHDLPTSRGGVYQSYVEKLLNSWEENRRPRSGAEGTPEFSLGALAGDRARRAALDGFYYVGWRLHFLYYGGKGDDQPTRESLMDSLHERLKDKWNLTTEDAKITAEDVLDFWQEAGILDMWRLGKREYLAFRHLTFEEYAASEGLAEAWKNNSKDAWKFLRPRLHHYAWKEPILLLSGMLKQDDLSELVRNLLGLNHWPYRLPGITWLLQPTCLPHGPSAYERFLYRDLFLAGNLLVEQSIMNQNIKSYIIKELSWLVHPHEKRLFLTLIATYFLGLAIVAIFSVGQFLPFKMFSPGAIFWTATVLWTAAWIGALVSGRFTRIRNGLGILLGTWSYLPDREPVISLLGQIGSPSVPELIRAMKNGEPDVRAIAAETLGRIKDVQAVPDLIFAMKKDGSSNVRKAAAKSLGQIGDVRAVPDLILALKDRSYYNWEIWLVAARALGEIGDDRAVPDLIQALKDGDRSVRATAAEVLGEIGDVEAVPDLIQALEGGNGDVCGVAAKALGEIGDVRAVPDLIRVLDECSSNSRIASEALGRIGLPAVPDLIERLMYGIDYVRWDAANALGKIYHEFHDQIVADPVQALNYGNLILRWWVAAEVFGKIKDLKATSDDLNKALKGTLKDDYWFIRRAAAEALGEMRDVQAVPDLILVLRNDESALVRLAAAEALGQIKDDRAVPDLIRALKDDHVGLRMVAAKSLGQIGDVGVVSYLILALNEDEEKFVRSYAAESLGQIGDIEAVPHLIRALTNENEDQYVRRAVVRALGKIGEVKVLHHLIRALKEDGDEDVRRAAAESLGKIGDIKVVPDLIRALKDEGVRYDAQEALGRIGSLTSPDLIIALHDEDWHVRQGAVIVLGKIKDIKSIPNLIGALKDDVWSVRYSAQQALRGIGISAFPYLIQALKDGDDRVRSGATESLDRIKSPALPDLIQMLDDENWTVRRFTVEALGRSGDVDAVPHLIRAVKDSNGSVRGAAASALGRNGDVDVVPYLIQAVNDCDGYVRSAAAEALGLLAGKLKKLADARSVSRSLRWRLTDQMFDHFGSSTMFHALNLAASRLAILEVEALTAEDPLSQPKLMPNSRCSQYVKMAYYPIILGFSALVLQIIYGIFTNQISDLNEGIAILTRNPSLTVLAVILGAVVFLSQDLYSKMIKE